MVVIIITVLELKLGYRVGLTQGPVGESESYLAMKG